MTGRRFWREFGEISAQRVFLSVTSQPEEGRSCDWEGRFMRVFLSLEVAKMENKKKKKHKESRTFNVYTADRDFENCNGWSLTVTSNDLEILKDSDFGAFYVNLTKGAVMAPHWNPMATEIAFVVAGQGMVRIVCSCSEGNQSSGENQSFRVEEGDVFMVPRFHPMSQTSFNNDSFVFMGFSTTRKRHYPQYLVGKQSVFQVIDKDVLAAAFNVDNETVVQLSGPQEEALILECTSCAAEQFSAWQEEERKKREEEEARKREDEEERRTREEEEAKRKEEKEARERERNRQKEEAAREKKKREGRGRNRHITRRKREGRWRKKEEVAVAVAVGRVKRKLLEGKQKKGREGNVKSNKAEVAMVEAKKRLLAEHQMKGEQRDIPGEKDTSHKKRKEESERARAKQP